MNEQTAVHVLVSGRVQGVFFRDATKRRAISLGLGGWVKNLPDGRVEVLFVGSRAACEQALEFIQEGPPKAHVTDAAHEWMEPPEDAPMIFEVHF